jgi:hypothetical protein
MSGAGVSVSDGDSTGGPAIADSAAPDALAHTGQDVDKPLMDLAAEACTANSRLIQESVSAAR